MSDIIAPETRDPATDAPSPAEQRLAETRAYWIGQGLDPAQFDAAVAKSNPGEPSTLWPTLTPAQVEATVAELRRAGVDETSIQIALAKDGYTTPVEDKRSPEQIEMDEAFPQSKPEDYRPDYAGRIAADAEPGFVEAYNTVATAWASMVGFPPSIGEHVIERALEVENWANTATDQAKQVWQLEQAQLLERMVGGPEAVKAELEDAAVALAKGSAPYVEHLKETLALKEVGVIRHLAEQGRRIKARGA